MLELDAVAIALIAVGVMAALVLLWFGFLLDRRSQRIKSAKWMRNWAMRTRVLSDLFRRWQGPLRLQDQRAEVAPPKKTKRKPATRRRKGSR